MLLTTTMATEVDVQGNDDVDGNDEDETRTIEGNEGTRPQASDNKRDRGGATRTTAQPRGKLPIGMVSGRETSLQRATGAFTCTENFSQAAPDDRTASDEREHLPCILYAYTTCACRVPIG